MAAGGNWHLGRARGELGPPQPAPPTQRLVNIADRLEDVLAMHSPLTRLPPASRNWSAEQPALLPHGWPTCLGHLERAGDPNGRGPRHSGGPRGQ